MNAALDQRNATTGNGGSVFTVLGERARAGSRRRLAGYLIAGLAAAVSITVFARPWWPAAALALSFAAFGVYGLVVRGRAVRRGSPRDAVRIVVAGAGTIAAAAFVVGLFLAWFTGDAIGTYTPRKASSRLGVADTVHELPATLKP
jgi:asparagine N-glycosylation enzyme membrane subunit Stt3